MTASCERLAMLRVSDCVRYGIRRIFSSGSEIKVIACGDWSFSLVIYRREHPRDYHLDLTEEAASRLLREAASQKHLGTS